MASNKEVKAQAEARRRAYEAKLNEVGVKAQRRKNDNRFALVVGILAVLLGVGATYGHTAFQAAQPTPTPTPVASTSTSASPSTSATPSASPTNSAKVPKPSVAQNRTWTGTISLNGKPLTISLDGAKAPQAVANFITLAKKGYFTNTKCHRLVTSGIYVLQCGDPTGTGSGGPGYNWGPIENAPADNVYKAGVLAMARVGGDAYSMGSQFFIVFKDSTIPSDNAGGYTVFGSVSAGLGEVDTIANQGVQGGGTDGVPTANAVLGAISVK